MKEPLFTGVCTALVTPFIYERINYATLDRLLERQLKAGINTIVLSGTTGESPTLDDYEKAELIYHAKSVVRGVKRALVGEQTILNTVLNYVKTHCKRERMRFC